MLLPGPCNEALQVKAIHCLPLAKRPLSLSHAAITAPSSNANPKKPDASEVERAPINSVEPVRFTPM